ncbi:MAG: phosphohistidine phosphatase SixA [Isosphaeraceae bacterium]
MTEGEPTRKLLYVVRHAIAQPHGTPGVADDARRLTPQGIRKFRKVALGVARLGSFRVDRIVTSPLPRADETARIVAAALGLESKLERDEALSADRSADSIREWLQGRPESKLMIVGHNPSLSDLIGLLLTGSAQPGTFEMRKGAVACLSSLGDQGWRLEWFVRPRLLRKLAE